MSAKATAYVWEHSPHNGATFIVHLALADVANDQHENELWMSLTKIAKKARCSRSTAQASLKELCGTGHLVLLKAGKENHQPGRYWMRTVPETEQLPEAVPESGTELSDLGARTVPEIGRVTKENSTNSSARDALVVDSHPLPDKDECAPPPWKAAGLTHREWMLQQNEAM